ncbi:MAG: GNAT family N-acetyltransferase [Nannocystaceae bacterium]
MDLTVDIAEDLVGVNPADWDALDHGGSPFTEYGFLRALERSRSVGEGTGWVPRYVLARREGTLLGALPAYLKTHSYGEYIFDWSWASGAQRAGLRYYPKLVVAVPMTPATGRRILLPTGDDEAGRDRIATSLVRGLMELATRVGVSSVHWLFCSEAERAMLESRGFLGRTTFQFHWKNRDYSRFEDFLGALRSRKRKQILKERRKAAAAFARIDFVDGADMTAEDTRALDRFYRGTVAQRGGIPYLEPGFFEALCELSAKRVRFCRVIDDRDALFAGALYLETPQGLFGRYWGSDNDAPFVHFEAAYYAGIERCIARGIPRFEAGAQGEHKLLRGFLPTKTHSCHWFAHPGLSRAVGEAIHHEEIVTSHRMRALAEYGPFKASSPG